ncbi:MAG: IS1380 family transposase [Gemmataceae bacterium]
MNTDRPQQLTFWKLGKQQVTATPNGGQVVSDAGLLLLRNFDKQLGFLHDLAARLPDPRAPQQIIHSQEAILTQQVYQILAGYPDCNDAQKLRHDPLFQTIADVSPDDEQPLASRSTMNRHQYAYTRRDARLPVEERPALLDQRAAQTGRIQILNEFLIDWFIRTRTAPPAEVVIDLDASDDPTHGQQILSGFHGYFDQHQYFPLFAFEGASGFPLAAWLRPGTVHGSTGAVDTLELIVRNLRAAWPTIRIVVRADTGFAVPALYDFCEAEGLFYVFGYATNAVLKRLTDTAMSDLELYYNWYSHREPHMQRFESIADYQAEDWARPRRIVAKLEINTHGVNRRFVVTNLDLPPQEVYRDVYVQRGNVPERPIGELKNGLQADRLSCHGFTANALRLLEHVVTYALVVLFREAAAAVPEVATAEVGTLRSLLWKVGAVVRTSARRIWFDLSETWPHWDLWGRVAEALDQFVTAYRAGQARAGSCRAALPM